MNRKLGIYSSALNFVSVFAFAVSMLFKSNYWSYFSSMFISFSFVPMICSFCFFAKEDKKSAGYAAMIFSAVYSVFILMVYFAQLTTVVHEKLTFQAASLIDYSNFGLFFNYDLLGYGLMALSTFFIGLTIEVKTKADIWLRLLLLIHGIFFISCLIFPMIGLFSADSQSSEWVGTAVLLFWCLYFIPVGVLSVLYFKSRTV
ncbi:MAG: hypothetical protein PQJ46_13315 [Spirochaetales bacterium]|nr:hypothetical protein [Spirochaetales bacterium]